MSGRSSIGQMNAFHSKSFFFFHRSRVERRAVVPAESAPEDEVLRCREGRNRVHLQEAEVADGLEDARGGPGEEL